MLAAQAPEAVESDASGLDVPLGTTMRATFLTLQIEVGIGADHRTSRPGSSTIDCSKDGGCAMNADNPMKQRIKHIVYLMLENRSFDNLLGWLYDGQARPPSVHYIGAPVAPDGPIFHGLTDDLLQKYAQPIQFEIFGRATKPIVRGVASSWFPCVTPILDPYETFEHVTNQLYGNAAIKKNDPAPMLGFGQSYLKRTHHIPDVYEQILHTYNFEELPVLNTLARDFGVSDLWFSSIPSQTSINRAYSISGNSVGRLTRDASSLCQMVNNHYWDDLFLPAQFADKTIWEVLADNGHNSEKDWRIYYSNIYLDGLLGEYKHSYTYLMFPSLQQTLEKKIASPLERMYNTMDQFYKDAAHHDLPAFTYLEPHYSFDLVGEVGLHGNDYHPPSDVKHGEMLVSKIYEALVGSGLMDETLLVISFDEHGGTFDHVSPPWKAVNPCPDVPGELGFEFDRYGVRVPTIFVSPWVRQNTVIRSIDSTPFDHTSWLATLLCWFDLDPALLGPRTARAPRFDGVIGQQKRECPSLPAPWDCKHAKGARRQDQVGLGVAVAVARLVAAKNRDRRPIDVLRELTEKCSTIGELTEFYRDA